MQTSLYHGVRVCILLYIDHVTGFQSRLRSL